MKLRRPVSGHLSPGALFMVGLPGLGLDDSSRSLIARFHINNFILFKRNFKDCQQLRELTAALRQACMAAGLTPPLIAIDQEGGTVARLGPPFSQFLGARQLASSSAPEEAVTAYARTCGRELAAVGINLNLAPVLDVCASGGGYFMAERSLGADPVTVARLGSLIISEMQACGLAACGKHFPGLGGAVVDPHRQLPVVDRSGAEMRSIDLVPFRAAVAADVAAIMTSHTIYRQFDGERAATLSPAIITGLLRNELGYEGVVITDDLEMGAIVEAGNVAEAALEALQAGADLLLICKEHHRVVTALQRVASAVAEGRLSPARLGQSIDRLASLRHRFGVTAANQMSL